MIAIKLILQTLAGVAAVGTACGAGYVYSQDTENQNHTYVIVTAQTPITESKKEESSLFTNDKKNYECKIGEVIDQDCEIYKLNSGNLNSKTLDLKFLSTKASKIKDTHTFTQNNNYVLKLNSKKFKDKKINVFSLRNKDENKKNKLFANFTFKHAFEETYQKIKSNSAVIKVLAIKGGQENTTSSSKFFCEINKTEKVECTFKKPSTDINISNYSSENWNSLTSLTAKNDLKDGHFYVVEFQKPQFRASLKDSPMTIFYGNDVLNSTEIAIFKYEQLLLGNTTTPKDLFFLKENHENFLFVTLNTLSGGQPASELITETTKKNYTCKLTTSGSAQLTDSTCELYKLTFDTPQKSLAFPLDNSKGALVTTKTELTANSLFKLRIDSDVFKNINFSSPQTIILESINSSDSNKTYATLTTKALFKNEELVGKTSLILGKPSATTDQTTYLCKFETAKSPCDIYKFSTSPTTKSTLNFSESTKVIAASAIKTSDFYILDLKSQTIDVNSTLSKIEVVKNDETPIFDFNIETPLIADITSTNKEAILIK